MPKSLDNLRDELEQKIIRDITTCSYNTFANIVEVTCGKKKADEFRQIAIAEGREIEMYGKFYNCD